MKGRPRKPEAALIAGGTYRKDRHNKPKMQPERVTDGPPMPEHLPTECAPDWTRICGLLTAAGILTDADLDAVARIVFLLDMERRARKDLSKDGPTVKLQTKHGEVHKPHPSFKVLMETGRELRALGERFGFDPYSRQRINVTPQPQTGGILGLMRPAAERKEARARFDELAKLWKRTPEQEAEKRQLEQQWGFDVCDFLFDKN